MHVTRWLGRKCSSRVYFFLCEERGATIDSTPAQRFLSSYMLLIVCVHRVESAYVLGSAKDS